MSRRKQRSTFDQVSEFDRGRIVAYRDCGLTFREIRSRVGRNQATLMRICDRRMQDGTTDGRGRSHPPQCTSSREDRQIVRMTVTDRSVTSRTIAQHIETVTHPSVPACTFFVNYQIELLPSPANSPDLSPMENMWSMVAQRLIQITLPAASPDKLQQRVEASWSAVPLKHILSLFVSMPRRVAAVIFNNGGYFGF
ncbi:transposable element Tcb1 transposase [Trichonephila clavipes]|nr:transposable element Tcb1 transposase [Trichonephila clavipes]